MTLFEKLEKIKDKYDFECSNSVIRKAERIITENRIKLVSPLDAYNLYFHVCPTITDTQKKGYEVRYKPRVDDWSCDCRHEVFRVDHAKICSHILAAIAFWEEMKS